MSVITIEPASGLQPPDLSALAARRAEHVGAGFKTAYGTGQVVESLTTVLLNTFFFFYITNVCGLSGSLTGLAMFLALAVDAVADPVIGSISDNLQTRWGRRIPVMALSLLPMGISLGMLFSIPRIASGWTLFLYVLALLMALRVSLSAFIIPFMGLGAELSDDYDERSSVVAFRLIFGMLATLAGFVLGFGVFLRGTDGLLNRAAYGPFGWTSAAVLMAAGALSTYASLQALPRMAATIRSKQRIWRRLFEEVCEVFRNPSFRLLFVGVLLFFVGQGVSQTLALDGSKYFWGLETGQIQSIAVAGVIGLALGLPIAFIGIGRVEKRTVFIAGITVICLALALPVLAQVSGMIPHNPAFVAALLSGVSVVNGIILMLIVISFQSALADAVDEHELLFSARREGMYFASLSFASKAATGLGSLLSGLLLDAIHFPSKDIAAGHVLTVAPATVRLLGFSIGPAAALITCASVVFFRRYTLDRRAHAEIRRLLERRAALNAA